MSLRLSTADSVHAFAVCRSGEHTCMAVIRAADARERERERETERESC